MDDFKGLAKSHPGIALCMTIFMLSLAATNTPGSLASALYTYGTRCG